MLSLKEKCVHPQTQTPYIVRSGGGIDNSPEGLQVTKLSTCEEIRSLGQGGLTHGFVAEFSYKEDRDYYVFKDSAHQAFIKSIDGKAEDPRVSDFEPGTY